MFGPWASLGGFGQQAGGGMGNQQMGWTAPGGAAPAWKMGGMPSTPGGGMSNQQMGWTAPGGAPPTWKLGGAMGNQQMGGGMGVYSPELMAMLRQRLAGMGYGGQQAEPMSGGYNMVSQPNVYPSAPAMPTNPGAFTPYQPPMQSQPMPVRPVAAPAPAPVAPTPAPVATPAVEPRGRRLLSRGYWASRGE